jgi:hypothetical protein
VGGARRIPIDDQPPQILHELPQVHPSGPIAIDGLSHPSPEPTLMFIHAVTMTSPRGRPSGSSALALCAAEGGAPGGRITDGVADSAARLTLGAGSAEVVACVHSVIVTNDA